MAARHRTDAGRSTRPPLQGALYRRKAGEGGGAGGVGLVLGAGNQLPVVALDILHKLVGVGRGWGRKGREAVEGRQPVKAVLTGRLGAARPSGGATARFLPGFAARHPWLPVQRALFAATAAIAACLASPAASPCPPLQVVDDEVVVVKMNPVNEYLGPFLRQA